MTAKEYLRQAYRLDQKINSDIAEAERLRQITTSVSMPLPGDRVQTTPSGEAPFVRSIEKLIKMEEDINREIDLYVDLKEQIRKVISAVPDTDERLILSYRYIHNFTWEQIARELKVDARTVRRWHGRALNHVVLPKDPIKI